MKKFIIGSSLAVIVAAGVSFSFTDNVNGNKADKDTQYKLEKMNEDGHILKTHSLNQKSTIKEVVSKDSLESKEIEVGLYFETLNQEDLTDYKNLNAQKINKLKTAKEEVTTTVTFSHPISVEAFEKFIKKNKIKVSYFNIETVGTDKSSAFIQGEPDSEDIVPQHKLDKFLNGGEVVGIYAFTGEVPAKNLDAISSESSVYLADVSEEYLFNKYKELAKDGEHLDISVPNVYQFLK